MKKTADQFSPAYDPAASPELQMLRLASGHVMSQAIFVFATLGIADILTGGELAVTDLAGRTGTRPDPLYRLLRFLASANVVLEGTEQRFSLTRLGRTLCRKPSSALVDNTLLVSSPTYWSSLGGLLKNVQTGKTAFDDIYQQDFFSFLRERAEAGAVFDAAMNSSSRLAIAGVLSGYDFGSSGRVVDVAGGRGALLNGILRKYPNVEGILFDAPEVIAQATPHPEVASRFSKVAGSFFESVPRGGNTYILRRILHDWNDEKAIQILRRCREAVPADGRLLVVEAAAPRAGESGNDWAALDILMMVLMDGRERTQAELQNILAAADFQVARVIETDSRYWIVEAVPAGK